MDHDEKQGASGGVRGDVGTSAIKWSAIVIIVGSVLYFLARYVIPLLR